MNKISNTSEKVKIINDNFASIVNKLENPVHLISKLTELYKIFKKTTILL